MKKVLVLGAGLVAGPLVRHLLHAGDVQVTVAARRLERAQAVIRAHPRGTAVAADAGDRELLRGLIAGADLCVSLLPPAHHTTVAQLALEARKHFLTTSYASDTMRELDGQARAAGLTFLSEVGLDPGIDHMSALRIIHRITAQGGTVVSFRSYCGGLPSLEDNTNPWGYKFSWSPRGVVLAGRNSARYLEGGEEREIPGERLFAHHWPVEVIGFGELEGYYNRDSLPYIDTYGLTGVREMFRATLRYPGWCFTMQKLADLGYFDLGELTDPPATYAALTRRLAGLPTDEVLGVGLARLLRVDPRSETMRRLNWLGLLDETPIGWPAGLPRSPLDALAVLMLSKMAFVPGERDLVIMQHEIGAEYPTGRCEQIVSTFMAVGDPGGDSAMARTVGLPAAIAAGMILDGRIAERGVLLPVAKAVYDPVLDELARVAGLEFVERVTESSSA